ncbi:MAG: hypothetical protein HZA61_07995 [Candidatus Eisenbacteria bacterium]|uniref:Fibronectin type-III domain-containing protein n=1 Tax=Eiseniibacteriota bacterium TaxID=2212470 RepID=A0A933SBE4_UNCEI|nr:hypothetical protein [Candidatus Eisenbacteria bacterium]
MQRPMISWAMLIGVAWCLALVVTGCGGRRAGLLPVFVNERPRVTLTAAPVNEADTSFYAYELHWSGYDPDGRIDHYEYAIDPKGGATPETTWIRTTRNGETIHFRASRVDSLGSARATEPHTFVIKAADNGGQWSPVVSRSFFAYTIAPTVQLTSPVYPAGPQMEWPYVTTGPALRISWEGRDEDAVGHRGPVLYRYRIFEQGDPLLQGVDVFTDPQELRRRCAATNFAGWDSTESDTPYVEVQGLQLFRRYLFVVVAIDEAGAYTADWAVGPNLLPLYVAQPELVAPRIGVSCPWMSYVWPTGAGDPSDVLGWVKFDAPATERFTLSWFALPSGNYRMAGYRWRLDGDLDGPGWSEWNLQTTQATLGPFAPGSTHFLYIQAKDDHGATSTAVVNFTAVATTFDRDLLVVDDTRLEVDYLHSNGTRRSYTTAWPSAAELDTFLYAVGGTPWRGAVAGRSGVTPPGLLAGYSFDTLSTRNGYEIASAGAPLSLLGRYRHVLWITDQSAAQMLRSPSDVVNGISLMRWMCSPGRSSPLAAYRAAGGSVWLAGGGAGYTSLIEYNAPGVRANDGLYGYGYTVFSNAAGELVPGRLMYDDAHWCSEFVCGIAVTSVNRSARAIGHWSNPGWRYAGTMTAPDYSRLPATLRRRSLALGDTIPPTRSLTQPTYYWTTGTFATEYLTRPNAIVEDADPDPVAVSEFSALDTLYEFRGGALATQVSGERPASMTWYHGVESPPLVFTGFPLWEWTRADCAALVDFVLHDIWGLQKAGTPSAKRAATARRAAPSPALRR